MEGVMFRLVFLLILLFSTSAHALEWRASCNSKYKKAFLKNEYTFSVRHGEVGGCKSDKVKQVYSAQSWDWSERSEVKSSNMSPGKYTWSADIEIDRKCTPAYRNTLFQVHSGVYLKQPPSWIGINRYNKFRANKAHLSTAVDVPDKFNLRAEIDFTEERVLVKYFVDNKFVIETKDYNSPYKEMFMKFGVYRVNSNCDIKQIYRNVKVTKNP